jgi:dipeptidyl aminopeptidase/acylaminoacyl peptidase
MNLTNDAVFDYAPAWSPNGSKIVFEVYDGNDNDLFVINWDGSGRTQITDNTVNAGGAEWSPDGTKLAFHQGTVGEHEIFVMNADGTGAPTNITNSPGDDLAPAWSPDGSRIAFASQRDGDYLDLYTMHSDVATSPNWLTQPGTRLILHGHRTGPRLLIMRMKAATSTSSWSRPAAAPRNGSRTILPAMARLPGPGWAVHHLRDRRHNADPQPARLQRGSLHHGCRWRR